MQGTENAFCFLLIQTQTAFISVYDSTESQKGFRKQKNEALCLQGGRRAGTPPPEFAL